MMTVPIIFSIQLEASQPDLQQVRNAIASLVTDTQSEPGCVTFIVHELAEQPGKFILWEHFADQDAYDAHMNAAYTRTYFNGAYTRVESSMKLKPLQ
jgi:quinol monooxygenase YgiN